jgi:hypothetical protein
MATPVNASFRGQPEVFDTSREAYTWLLRKFIVAEPEVLRREGVRGFITKGRCRTYIAKERRDLCPHSPQMADDPYFSEEIAGGWFAITNLDNETKFGNLSRYALVAGFKYDIDWTWDDGVKRPRPADPIEIEIEI